MCSPISLEDPAHMALPPGRLPSLTQPLTPTAVQALIPQLCVSLALDFELPEGKDWVLFILASPGPDMWKAGSLTPSFFPSINLLEPN